MYTHTHLHARTHINTNKITREHLIVRVWGFEFEESLSHGVLCAYRCGRGAVDWGIPAHIVRCTRLAYVATWTFPMRWSTQEKWFGPPTRNMAPLHFTVVCVSILSLRIVITISEHEFQHDTATLTKYAIMMYPHIPNSCAHEISVTPLVYVS